MPTIALLLLSGAPLCGRRPTTQPTPSMLTSSCHGRDCRRADGRGKSREFCFASRSPETRRSQDRPIPGAD